jgi:putative methionine-R-sulfoxide reductase with GAF domain
VIKGGARDWERIRHGIVQAAAAAGGSLPLREFVDCLWRELSGSGVSWLGIYLADPAAPEQLLLGACRDRPACSPIGLHGVCGQSFRSRRTVIVEDVETLGEAYIACDPSDRSELVVPLIDPQGCWGVLDLDSRDVGSFLQADAEGLARAVAAASLRRPG